MAVWLDKHRRDKPMKQLNHLQDWETEMDRLERIHKEVIRARKEVRQEIRMHELFDTARWLILVGVVLAAWYLRTA